MADTAHLGHLEVARRLLLRRGVLRSLWLSCVLAVAAPAIAQAQSAPQVALVAKAQASVARAQQTVNRLSAHRAQLTTRYQQQLVAIDRLKKQKASWRRDRELNSAQADANDTAKRLTAVDRQLATAKQQLRAARTAVVQAIDAELAIGTTPARASELAKLRASVAPPAPTPKKIVIPNAEIDPLADPAELERQAAALAAVERQLEAQRKGLDAQHRELRLVAELRSAHDRAGELSTRDDDQPRRGTPRSGSRETSGDSAAPALEDAPPPSEGGDSDSFGGGRLTGGASFETNVVTVLGEVVDRSTIDGLVRASRSGDPKQRAEAARLARDAVARRLEQLRKKRAMIEARAKKLRASK